MSGCIDARVRNRPAVRPALRALCSVRAVPRGARSEIKRGARDGRARSASELRGGAVGALTAALAVAAHAAAGGGTPSSAAATLLLLMCVALGVAAAATMSRTPGPVSLAAWLGAGQVAGHAVMSLHIGDHASNSAHASPGPSMLLAHAAAVAACSVLVHAGERLWSVVTSVLYFARPFVRASSIAHAVAVVQDAPTVSVRVASSAISRRGPPAALAAS